MNRFKVDNILAIVFLLCTFVFVPTEKITAQDQKVELEIEVSNMLQNSQFIRITNLGLDKEGRGPVLVSGFMQNLTNEVLEDLFLEIRVNAGTVGQIANITSRPGFPFSLKPMQSVYVTNNSLGKDKIPGISETVKFDGDLTPEGDNFIENLDGSTTLPADLYSLEVIIYQINNEKGKVALASAQVEVGGDVSISESVDFFLRTPGDVIEANTEITNPYPQFSWEGDRGVEYRVIVVKGNGNDSPESLLQSARSSAPVGEGGSLLQYENLDVNVRRNSYQYPSSGAQPLEAGQTYYWQLSTIIRSSRNTEERTSEIWGFKLAEAETADAPVVFNSTTKEAIEALIGNGRLNGLINSGYSLQAFEIDGVNYSGNQAAIILTELLDKIERGDIVLKGK